MESKRIYKVLVLEPSALLAAGVRSLLADFPDFRLLDAEFAGDPAAAIDRIASMSPDIVMIDPSIFPPMRRMPIRHAFPVLQEVVLVALCHAAVDEELLGEFDEVLNIYDSPSRIHHKLRHAAERGAGSPQPEGYELSEREREILVAVARGKTNKEIADLYCISIHTVISHRKNIVRKTGIKTIAGLTVYALLNNLISEADAEACLQ